MKPAYLPAAYADFVEAYNWYFAIHKNLALRFFTNYEACLKQLQKYPQSGPKVYKDVRMGRLKGFPYSILYTIQDERLYIIAVHHHKRSEALWQKRVE